MALSNASITPLSRSPRGAFNDLIDHETLGVMDRYL
jgi:hypothetical protein